MYLPRNIGKNISKTNDQESELSKTSAWFDTIDLHDNKVSKVCKL